MTSFSTVKLMLVPAPGHLGDAAEDAAASA
jgi:hypothetical protein